MMKRALLFAALIAWSGMASAVVYKWVDAQGKVQYGDLPPDGVRAEIVELLGTHSSVHTASAPGANSSATATTPAKMVAQNGAPQGNAKDTVKQQVATDVAQAKEKQCTEAQDRYKKLIEGRRIYKPGADGERQYLTADEIDSERINAKRDIDATCNAPS
jgi:hypothetical protein